MVSRSIAPRLIDMIEAIEVVRATIEDVTLEGFEADRNKRWLVERAVEIISEASRHLGDDLKDRNPRIPWQRVAGIGNVLRHDYSRIAPEIIWLVARQHLPDLETVCRQELAREKARP